MRRSLALKAVWKALLPLALFSSAFASAPNRLYVSWDSGNDTENCLKFSLSLHQPCKTLTFLSLHLKPMKGLSIQFLGNTQHLSSVAEFSDFVDLSVFSMGEETVMQCDGKSSGLKFVRVVFLHIANVTFTGCGSLQESTSESYNIQNTTFKLRSAIYMLNCTNVCLDSVQCIGNNGIGVALFDVNGNVTFVNSNFSENAVCADEVDKYPGGGGIYIELTECTPGRVKVSQGCDSEGNPYINGSRYTISNCNFYSNRATNTKMKLVTFITNSGPSVQRLGFGGGISIAFLGFSSHNRITIATSTFINNTASIGGGVSVQFDGSVNYNTIEITNSTMKKNKAINGGGGVQCGLNIWRDKYVKGNAFGFRLVEFIGNEASYGGGTSIFSSSIVYNASVETHVSFTNCFWDGNRADVGAAMVFFPGSWTSPTVGSLPQPVFRDCTFVGNEVKSPSPDAYTGSEELLATCIVCSSGFSLIFSSSISFEHNSGSAVLISAGMLHIDTDATVFFTNNTAMQGGAIFLTGFAEIILYENSTIIFRNNFASSVGGAICHVSIDYLEYINSRRCFIQYYTLLPPHLWDTSLVFSQNSAQRYGHSIYTTSLIPCAKASFTNASNDYNVSDALMWAPFHYDNQDSEYNIATDPATILVQSDLKLYSGLMYNLSLVALDDIQQQVQAVVQAYLLPSSLPSVQIASSSEYISDGTIKVTGPEGTNFSFEVQTFGSRQIGLILNASLLQCPPGYVQNANYSCVCSVGTEMPYPGIVGCVDSVSKGMLQVGYWAGCFNTTSGPLLTAPCPLGFCTYKNSSNGFYTMPSDCTTLDKELCGHSGRTGWLCGKCQYSVYYHSNSFKCAKCSSPALGWVYYVVSELVPEMVMLVAIVALNISLTSGEANSFIFFVQVMNLYKITVYDSIPLSSFEYLATRAYQFIFGFANLDFFTLDELSFCMWEGATVLDMLAMKYATVAVGLLLVVGLSWLVQHFTCRCRGKNKSIQFASARHQASLPLLRDESESDEVLVPSEPYRRMDDEGRPRNSVVHGLCAFFIVTYAQCASVSFGILSASSLQTGGGHSLKDVVLVQGDTVFLSDRHLRYAAVATLVGLVVFVIPVFFILEPLYHLLRGYYDKSGLRVTQSMHACNHNRNCFTRAICALFTGLFDRRYLWLNNILDIFQSCYKDNRRFYAGVLFLYRLVIAACLSLSTTPLAAYLLLEISLAIMFFFHSLFRPYKRECHNVLEGFILADLVIVNGITIFNHASTSYFSKGIVISVGFQLVLIYLTMTAMVLTTLVKFNCFWCCNVAINKVLSSRKAFESVDKFQSDKVVNASLKASVNTSEVKVSSLERQTDDQGFVSERSNFCEISSRKA